MKGQDFYLLRSIVEGKIDPAFFSKELKEIESNVPIVRYVLKLLTRTDHRKRKINLDDKYIRERFVRLKSDDDGSYLNELFVCFVQCMCLGMYRFQIEK